MQIHLFQGSHTPPVQSNVTIVVDVIRAFTVSFYALLQGADRILLMETAEQAIKFRQKNPTFLLAGETNGYPIEGFNFENSPYQIKQQELKGRTLVQKTTNGVRAALNCLDTEHLFVTGFAGAKTTAEYVREEFADRLDPPVINIVASHPTDEDDFACAVYIKSILEGSRDISFLEVINRIRQSEAAEKFFDEKKPEFKREDLLICLEERPSDFVMKVNGTGKIPMIERVIV
ncbi:2-phosphosulfolactate phosphatase [Virgibacillus kekensis]|uniref:Probable 2-phosphosulfolactate phosphatase n=1 Tax=Virgibacillus kekensis TaxID=202261 RepID=A0ABV9DN42_9BACI